MFATLLDRRISGKRLIPNDRVLSQEAVLFLLAGTDTVANTLTVAVYHTLADPTIRGKLVDELKSATMLGNKSRDWTTDRLQRLPYLVSGDLSRVMMDSLTANDLDRMHQGSTTFVLWRSRTATPRCTFFWT